MSSDGEAAASRPDGPGAVSQRNDRHLVVLSDADVAAVRPLIRVEFERPARLCQSRVQYVPSIETSSLAPWWICQP